MTSNKPNLSDLIKRNQQLEKENAVMREALQQITSMSAMYSHIADAIELARLGLTPISQSPIAEAHKSEKPEIDFTQVVEGMDVYDSDGARVGMIESISLPHNMALEPEAIIEALTGCFDGRNPELPSWFYLKMYMEGFMRVNRGLLRRDGIVFPNQIEDMGNESIYLNIAQFEIVKL